jgi:HD superfamily phosphohydrolase
VIANGAILARKKAAVRLLALPDSSARIYPGLTHELTWAERVVLETRSMQRMTRLRQTGLAYLTIPTNENTRLVHCMGTSYWSARFVDRMRQTGYDERLAFLDAMLGEDLSLDLLVRLYALVHDSDLLPFGHTLSYQLGYYPPPGSIPRFQAYVARIADEAVSSPSLDRVADAVPREEIIVCLRRHLDAVAAVAVSVNQLAGRPAGHRSQSEDEVAALLPVYTFVETLVTATVSADLLDFSLRDTLGAAIPWHFDTDLLDAAAVYAMPPNDIEEPLLTATRGPDGKPVRHLYRFGVNGVRGGERQPAAVSAVCDLLRVRYVVLEQIVYSRGKCVADAMLDKAIRNLNAHHVGEPFPEEELLSLGDDQFVDMLEREEAKTSLMPGCRPVMGDLLSRRLFTEAYRLEDRDRLSTSGAKLLANTQDAVERDTLEELLLKEMPELVSTDIAVSCLPLTMQMKEPDIAIGWENDRVLPLHELARTTGYGTEALATTERYSTLWSLSVYTRRQSEVDTTLVKDTAARLFER